MQNHGHPLRVPEEKFKQENSPSRKPPRLEHLCAPIFPRLPLPRPTRARRWPSPPRGRCSASCSPREPQRDCLSRSPTAPRRRPYYERPAQSNHKSIFLFGRTFISSLLPFLGKTTLQSQTFEQPCFLFREFCNHHVNYLIQTRSRKIFSLLTVPRVLENDFRRRSIWTTRKVNGVLGTVGLFAEKKKVSDRRAASFFTMVKCFMLLLCVSTSSYCIACMAICTAGAIKVAVLLYRDNSVLLTVTYAWQQCLLRNSCLFNR